MPSITKQGLSPKNISRIVIKVGSNVLTHNKGLRNSFFNQLANDINYLISKKIKVVIVSSGAIAAAMSLTGQQFKPKTIPQKQALAAMGQPVLMSHYARVLKKMGLQVAQILITQDGLENRKRFINAKRALNELLNKNIIPIVNENDTVTIDEIKIGDNDQLSAHVAHLINADLLIMLTHVDGLFDKNPNKNKNAQIISEIHKIDSKIENLVYHEKNHKSVGGMATKLLAAKIANSFNIPALITNGLKKNIIKQIFEASPRSTLFIPSEKTLKARKHWISKVQKPKGTIIIDSGAIQALIKRKKSLLPSGIKECNGNFSIGDCIAIATTTGKKLGQGLTNYSHQEINLIKGRQTKDIEQILGYKYGDEVIHRDDMVID